MTKKLLGPIAVAALAGILFAFAAATAFAEDGSHKGDKERGFGFFGGTSVSIGGEGRTLVRGAEVTAVNDGSFTATTEHGDTTLTWTIDTGSDTEYVGKNGSDAERNDIEEGDIVSFSGVLESSFTVAADVVREWAYALGELSLSGSVDERGSDHFTLEKGKNGKDVIVYVDSSTDITVQGDDNADYGDIENGMRVKVVGEYDEDAGTLEASSIVATEGKGGKDYWKPFADFWGKMKARFEHR